MFPFNKLVSKKITAEEQHALSSRRVGVVGLSAGNAVATTLALERSCGELRIADFDTFALSNLNRVRTRVHELEMSKVYATCREIAEFDPFFKVTCFPEGVTAGNVEDFLFYGGALDAIIEECDGLDMKILIRRAARAHRIPVVMATSDRGMLDVERFDREPEMPLFHGRIGNINPDDLRGLSTEEKVPFVLQILGVDDMPVRSRGSLMEIGQSVSTWPQLASDVMLGGASAANVARRILLGEDIPSGRYFIDLDVLIPVSRGREQEEEVEEEVIAPPPPTVRAHEQTAVASHISDGARSLERIGSSPGVMFIDENTIRSFVEDAITAPSGGNTQPWLWVYKKPVLLLLLNTLRSGTILDFCGNGSIAALGAAAENLVLAARHSGFETDIRLFPDQMDPSVVAAFEFRQVSAPAPALFEEWYRAINVRRTNRRLGERRELPPLALEELRAAVHSIGQGAELIVLSSADKLAELGTLLGAGDRLRMFDRKLHEEMMGEMRWTEEEVAQGDGISVADLSLSLLDTAGLRLCRDWSVQSFLSRVGGGGALEGPSRKAIGAASAAALLLMPSTSREDYFAGGRAMERVWLTAAARGIAFQPMSALPYLFARIRSGEDGMLSVETRKGLQGMRRQYEGLFGLSPNERRGEILLFRLAEVASPEYRSLRRPVHDVLSVVS